MITVLRQRNFALLWWSGLISFTGDWMLGIARPLFVYQMTGSALATSLMFIAGTLPRIFLASVAGVYVDRWNRQRVMVIANVILAFSVLPMLLVRTPDMLWIIYVSGFVVSSVAQFVYPSENALLPTLVDKQYLVTANALNGLNNNLSRLIGPAVGGLLMASVGFSTVVVIDAVTFLVAALLISAVRVQSKPTVSATDPSDAARKQVDVGRVWREWWAGLKLVRSDRVLMLLFTVSAITSVGEGTITVLFSPFALDILKTDAAGVGLLMSSQAIGGLVGGVVIARLGERLPLWKMLGWGCLLLGLIDAFLFNYPLVLTGIGWAIAALVIVGVPAAAAVAGMMTLLQRAVEDNFRGRVFGALVTTGSVFSLIGMVVAGTLGEVVGAQLINIQSVAYVITGVMVLLRSAQFSTPPVSVDERAELVENSA